MKNKRKFLAIAVVLLTFAVPCWAGGSKDKGADTAKKETVPAQAKPDSSAPLWTGEGGKGISLAVLEPTGKGLLPNEQWMLSLIQSSITGDFNKYSAMTIIDRQNLEKILAEQMQSMTGYYSESDYIKIGQLTNAKYILGGSVSRTANAFMLELSVTDVESGVRKASLSPVSVTPASLENLSAVKDASADLLRQLGVILTDRGLAELKKPLAISQVNAETALAKGVTAQKQGTEVAALSYYFQAVSLDSSLTEAARRSSTMSANISSGNIGADIRNDIVWRRDWVARLTETENFLKNLPPPYTLFYSTGIETGAINYQTETADLKIQTIIQATGLPSLQKALQAVYDGLNATKRKNEWGLANWPSQSITNPNSFTSRKQYDIQVVFELVNNRNQVLGRQTINIKPGFSFSLNNNTVGVKCEDIFNTVTFNAVNANDISDTLTIRIASVNGAAPQNTQFQITAISPIMTDYLKIENGVLKGVLNGFRNSLSAQYGILIIPEIRGKPITSIDKFAFSDIQLTSVIIPNGVTSIGVQAFWRSKLISASIPNSVTSIGDSAFSENQLTSITIPNSVTSIGGRTFYGNQITSVTIPNSVTSIGGSAFGHNQLTSVTISNSVTSIGESAFDDNQLTSVTIPNSVTNIGNWAFGTNQITSIIIGANVRLGYDPFGGRFGDCYDKNKRAAGTYTRPNANSNEWTMK